MNPTEGRDSSERDQLWASLRALRNEIDALAAGDFDGSDRQRQLVLVLAQVIVAEMKYQSGETTAE